MQLFAYLSPDLTFAVSVAFSVMFALASILRPFVRRRAVARDYAYAFRVGLRAVVPDDDRLDAGPPIVGLISDELQATQGEHSSAHAMALIGVVNIWAAAHYFFAARRYRADLAATTDLDAAI